MASKQIGFYLERTTRSVKLNFVQAFAKAGINLTPEQWVIIDRLHKQNGQSQTELANSSYKNAPTISRILDVLERKTYIERQRFENDRRRYKIFLTPMGQEVAEKALPLAESLRAKGWKGLSDSDYEILIFLLDKVFGNFEA